jgi:hypothetical protein
MCVPLTPLLLQVPYGIPLATTEDYLARCCDGVKFDRDRLVDVYDGWAGSSHARRVLSHGYYRSICREAFDVTRRIWTTYTVQRGRRQVPHAVLRANTSPGSGNRAWRPQNYGGMLGIEFMRSTFYGSS